MASSPVLEARRERLNRIATGLEELKQRERSFLEKWWNDPVQWVADVLPGVNLASYQKRALTRLASRRRLALRAPRGGGKTMPAALAFWWFATTRELAGEDWKIPSTAGSQQQLDVYLWPEIHKWARLMDWSKLAPLTQPRVGQELLTKRLKWPHGEGFGRATDDPQLIEGAHADHILVIIDEGKSVVDGIWDAIEGFFSNPGEHYALALSTPGAPAGRFYEIHQRKAGYEDWDAIHVKIDEAIEDGRITEEWRAQRERQWGPASVLYRCHVLAEFAGEEDGVIPLNWVEAAVERWKAHEWTYQENGEWKVIERTDNVGPYPRAFGVDVADTGNDKSVIVFRDGDLIYRIDRFTDGDPLLTADRTTARAARGTKVAVDAIGIGSGTAAKLKQHPEITVAPFVASAGTNRKDRSGDMGFAQLRSAAWWNLRELLDPGFGATLCLPPDDELMGDLTAPRWREVSGGNIQVEPKDQIRKRLGRSTDVGDALVMVMWEDDMAVALPDLSGWTDTLGGRSSSRL